MTLTSGTSGHSFSNIGGLLRWGRTSLLEARIESEQLDAEVLLASVLGIDRTELFLRMDQPVSPHSLVDFREKIERRTGHEPVAYLVGWKEFWSLPFKVGPGVLIPRPETEVLIETVVSSPKRDEGALRMLDVGTGSGNIAVSLAKELRSALIDAVDVSPAALSYAKYNAGINDLSNRISFWLQDVLTINDPRPTGHYDLIVSNPPYIRSGEIEKMDPTIKNFEPRNSLDGGLDGLNFYRVLARKSSSLLKRGGTLAVEIGEDQGSEVSGIFWKNGLEGIEVIKDYAGLPRVVVAYQAQSLKCKTEIKNK